MIASSLIPGSLSLARETPSSTKGIAKLTHKISNNKKYDFRCIAYPTIQSLTEFTESTEKSKKLCEFCGLCERKQER